MKRTHKTLSALTACALLIGTAGCGGGGRTTAETTAGSAASETAAATTAATTTIDPNKEIDLQIDYDEMADIGTVDSKNEEGAGKLYESGKTAGACHVLSWFDFHVVEPEKNISELYAERFGGTVETEIVSSLEVTDRLGVLMASGQSPEIMRMQDNFYPTFFMNNRFMAMDDWLDISSPLWADMSDIIEHYSSGGKHYYWPYGMTTTEYGVTYCTAGVEETGSKDPMDLYFDGEWTWNEFEDIMLKWKDFNPGKYPCSWPTGFGVELAATTGTSALDFDGKNVINNLRDPNVMRAMEFIEKLAREECFWEGWHGPDQLESWTGTLFFIMPLDWALPCGQERWFKNNFEGEIRSVPMPRDPDSDTYYLFGKTSGYVVPSGAVNTQGAAAYLLASRIWNTDPEVVQAERDRKMYNGGYYYIKCPECKHAFDSEYGEIGETCPECGTPRKAKWKLTYTEEQMRIYDELLDPNKFTFVFSCYQGFGSDMEQIVTDMVNGPVSGQETYGHLLDEYYNVVETELNNFMNSLEQS